VHQHHFGHAKEDVHGTGLIKAIADQLLAQYLEVLSREIPDRVEGS